MRKLITLLTLIITINVFGQIPSYVPSDSLVGWWPFNGNANDASVNTNDGTVNGATLTTDRLGNASSAYDFDGLDDWIEVNHNNTLNINQEFSICAHIKASSLPPISNSNIIEKGSTANGWEYALRISNSGNIKFHLGIPSGTGEYFSVTSTTVINLNQDYFITATFSDGISGDLYINGVFDNQSTDFFSNYQYGPGTSKLIFGARRGWAAHDDPTYLMEGSIDDIGIWNRALTQCEISALYHAQQLTPPVVSLGADTLSTCGATTTLDAGTDPSWASYLWNTTETTQGISVSNSGLYTIAVTDTNGCVGYDTTLVSILDLTIDQIDTNICIGDSLTLNIDSLVGNSCIPLPNNLQTGLITWYSMCGNANDQINGHDGTINGGLFNSDRFSNSNSSYEADGTSSDFITVSHNLDLDPGKGSFTVAGWIRSSDMDIAPIVEKNDNNGFVLWLRNTTGNPAFRVEDGLVQDNAYGTTSYADGQWHHLVGIRDSVSKQLFLYVDGQLITSVTDNTTDPSKNSEDLYIGRWNGTSSYTDGDLDDIGYWNRALSSSEVLELYQSGEYAYSWSTGDTTSSITVQPTTTTTYSVTVDDGISSCQDSVTITVNSLPTVYAGLDQIICDGDSIILNATGANIYSWNNGVIDGVAFNPSSTTEYIVMGTDTLGCMAEDTATITVNSLPIVDAGTFQQICDGDTVTLSGSGASIYLWDNSVTDGVGFTPSSTNTYTLTGTDINGCEDTDTVTIGVWALPPVSAGADQTICLGDTVTLSGSGASFYLWDNSVTDGVEFTPLITTTYTLTGTDVNSCSDQAYVTITVNSLPTVYAGLDQIICDGDSIILNATGANIYSWNNGVIDSVTFTPLTTTTYTVIGTDSNGCKATDSITITVSISLNVIAGIDTSICEGESITLSATGAVNYNWDNGVIDGVPFSPINTLNYIVIGTDSNNCSGTDTLSVTVKPSPEISGTTTSVSYGGDGNIDVSILNGTAPYVYDWDIDGNGDFDDNEDLSNLDAGTYMLIIMDSEGCKDTLILIVTETDITINSLLTPNGDGINDVWNIDGLSNYAQCKVNILNRWGQILYNSIGYAIPWDGTYNGTPLPASDYFYIIDLGNGGQVYKGTITIKY